MTYEELQHKLALEKLVETGIGLVSEKTYNDITALFVEPKADATFTDMKIDGIRLIKNPFIPDGEIWPFEEWDLRPKLPNTFGGL